MITFERIHISRLDFNTGQIPGLPANPREWTDAEIKKLARSMKQTPELAEARGCIVVPYEGRYVVLGGNLRLAGAKYLKWSYVMCAQLPEGTPVAKLKEIVLKDNSSFGSWDLSLLRKDWGEFDLGDWGINVTWDTVGTDPDASSGGVQRDAVEDDFDEKGADIEKRCRRGDIWQLGDHRLMCGDSTKVDDVQMLMGGAEADMVFTDPPYNVAIGDKNKMLNKALRGSHLIERNLDGDVFQSDEECSRSLWLPAFRSMRSVARDKCAIYVTMPQGISHIALTMAVQSAGWNVKHEIIWVKNNATFSLGRLDYDYKHEPICFGWNKSHKKIGRGKFHTSVWEINRETKTGLHPTMKPIELIVNALMNSSEETDNILDCFGGSGSTLMACEQTGRHCYMMEYDEHYCDVIIARWEKFTGRKATKIEL